jgi:hypothetical protein
MAVRFEFLADSRLRDSYETTAWGFIGSFGI